MTMTSFWRRLIIALFLTFMVLPVLATLLFSFSTLWYKTIWPEGFTLDWWAKVITSRNFSRTLNNSLWLSGVTSAILMALVTPSAFWAFTKLPRSKPIFEFMVAISFGIPGVILALSLLRFYSKITWLPLVNSPRILICACMVLCFPYMYRPIANALESIDVKTLNEAAASLGAGWWATLFKVIVPNIIPGMINGFLLTFSTVFAEFALTNLLVGSRFKTFPLYIVEFTRFDSRQASALAVVSFSVAWIISMLILWIVSRSGKTNQHVIGGR